ncbi:YfhO family protein [Leifsonia sp. YIM 134122]|uniref:YfhO family protein n=1 Tax=Leifsonia stereocauli TaxID=3134136 RepID=A0ABU9W3I5_9MICO
MTSLRSRAPGAATLRRHVSGAGVVGVVSWAALVVFTLVSIGTPLLGIGSFLDTRMFASFAPWASATGDTNPLLVPFFGDTVDSAAPQVMLLVDTARAGSLAEWNPFVAGGSELGGLPNSGAYSPLSLPWWVLPPMMAAGYVKLLEIVALTAGMCLLLRRLGVHRAAWPLASLVFASSGFMIAWTNWPQTRVAAFIPLLFWAVDRVAVRPRAVDLLIIGPIVAAMLLGGFPAITGYALYAAGAWFLVRSITTHRRVRPVLAAAGVAVGGIVVGGLLAAWQMIPFAINALSVLDFDVREQNPMRHLAWSELASVLIPDINGGPEPVGIWVPEHRVEAFSYLGAATLVLMAAAILVRPRTRSRLSGRTYLVWALLISIALTYAGGILLAIVQELPIFSNNYIGRLRVMIGFFAAVLAAMGLSALLDPVPLRVEVRLARRSRAALAAAIVRVVVVAAVAVAAVILVIGAYRAVPVDRLDRLRPEVGAIAACAVLAVVLVALVWLTAARWSVVVAGIMLPLLVVSPALYVTSIWWPTSPSETFYPSTSTHDFLEEELGDDRFATVDQAMMPGSNTAYGLRSVDGHGFHTVAWKDLLTAVDPDIFKSATYSTMTSEGLPVSSRSPILDRLGVRYLVVPPAVAAIGAMTEPLPADGAVAVDSGAGIESAVYAGPIRGLSFDASGLASGDAGVDVRVDILDVDGAVLASTTTWVPQFTGPRNVAIAGDSIPAATRWTARLTLDGISGPVPVATSAGTLAIGVVRPVTGDGIRTAQAGDATVYERTTALERVRWASSSIVIADADDRVEALADGAVPADAVVLDTEEDVRPTDTASTASIEEDDSDDDSMRFSVDATGSGWLLVEDSLRRPGWTASVDGVRVDIVAADHAAGAVHVPAGSHTVELTYRTPGFSEGIAVSVVGAVGSLLAVGILALVRRRREPRQTSVS